MTPKMQEALDRLVAAGNLPKSAFHHSTVTALLKAGHAEELPGDSTWITAREVVDLPRRDPAVPTVPIDDDVIASGVHVDRVQVCPCGRMAGDRFHKRHCPVQEAAGIVDTTVTPKAWIRQAAQTVADATSWVCRGRVKPTRVSRRRVQRGAMAR